MTTGKQTLIDSFKKTLRSIARKRKAKGYVVAGYGGETYYCFVGAGNGYQGAALVPESLVPVVFKTEKDAEHEAYNGIYRNGNDQLIKLEAVKASEYFSKMHERYREIIEQIENM